MYGIFTKPYGFAFIANVNYVTRRDNSGFNYMAVFASWAQSL